MRRQEQDGRHQLGWIAEAPEGDPGADDPLARLGDEELLVHGRREVTRAHRVDPDPVPGQLERHHARELDETGLAHAVGGHVRDGGGGTDGGHVDDTALPLRHHLAGRRLGQERRRPEVHAQDRVPVRRGEIEERRRGARDASVVEEDVQAAEETHGRRHERRDLRVAPEVGQHDLGPDPVRGRFLGRPAEIRGAPRRQHEVGAGLGQRQREGPPESPAGPGHQGD
jgi:hypothetical protein